jgi:hypothetical protein
MLQRLVVEAVKPVALEHKMVVLEVDHKVNHLLPEQLVRVMLAVKEILEP